MTAVAHQPQPLTVALGPASSDRHRSVLASLPRRFLPAERGPADVVVVVGEDAAWPDAVARAVDEGARGVLVANPSPIAADPVRRIARAVEGRAVVVVDTAYADDRTWNAARAEVAVDAADAALVDSLVRVPGDGGAAALDRALLDQLAVVRPLLGAAGIRGELRLLHRGERAYLFTATTAGPRITLAGAVSATGRHGLTLDVVAARRRWEVRFNQTSPGRPTEVSRHDRDGRQTRPLVHESGRRTTWQRLHAALTSDHAPGYGLDDLADDLELVTRPLARTPEDRT